MHSWGFHHRVYHWRRSGMSATWCALLLMVLANLWYMPWELVSPSVSAQYAVFVFSGLTLCLTAIRFFRADCQPRRLDL